MARRGKAGRRSSNSTEHKVAELIDDLNSFDEFRNGILKELRTALKSKNSSEEILQRAQAFAAARLASIAATEEDSAKALSAIKDLLDRTQGKPAQKQEIEHKFQNLSDDQLDAIVVNHLNEIDEDEEISPH